MSDIHDDDLSELERRMRAKLFASPVQRGLTEDEERIAAKLIGTDNARRVANAREGRRVRLAPVVKLVRYWWVPSGDLRPDSWHLELLVNHRREERHSGMDAEDLQQRLAAYRRQNIITEAVPLFAKKAIGGKAR